MTSDRGLCGGFNANICKAADRFLKERKGEFNELSVMTIGRKGYDFLKNRYSVSKNYTKFGSYLQAERAKIVPAQLLNEAGIVGAAMASWKMSSSSALRSRSF